jgi:2-keto-myo-inositol isomerase
MQLAFHGATTMTSDLETDITVTARAGFKALEIWAVKIDRYLATHKLDELNALFVDHDIQPITLNSIEFIAFRGQEYHLIQDRLRELTKVARAIHCPTIIVVPSPTPSREISWTAIVDEYVRILRDLGDIASESNLKLAFEFLGFGWCSVRTPRAAMEILQKVDRANIGLTLDAAHFYAGGGLMTELNQLDPGRIFTFHLNDLEDSPREAISDSLRIFPGQGVVPLDEICHRLQGIGYDGPCSIELFRPEYWDWDPFEVAVKARQSALKVLSPYFLVT